ncbi:Ava_C0101 and related proteins [Sphingomonas antarctica]|uniref:DUF5996 family protein n=1 Tax=Sphingomonas antarctica TaxID=2040274 RepID=UPI0039E9D78A
MNVDWPALDYAGWAETQRHLHLLTQIVGKVRLAHTPWINHSWHVTLYPTACGLTTGPIPAAVDVQLDFDFVDQLLIIASARGDRREFPLRSGSVADAYQAIMAALTELGAPTVIDAMPSEMHDAIAFDQDRASRPWDGDAVRRFHRVLLSAARVFTADRSAFLGKVSPVHFFWGSCDLAVTRFSGRRAPRHPGGMPGLPDAVACEAYSHEEASLGFWPGDARHPRAAFYAYAYPAPAGYAEAAAGPGAYDTALGEFLLDYDTMRQTPDPDATLLRFARVAYAAAADLGAWDRAALDCPIGVPGQPRLVP